MSLLQEVEVAVAEVARRVGPATVRIGRDGRGAGVVVGDGQVLTNAHNLRGATATVTFADGRQALADVRGVDADGDVALLAVDTAGAAAPAWADGPLGLGAAVLAVAHGPRGVRVTTGAISATDQAFRGPRGRRVLGGIEHTAPLARRSSGGPLVDVEGRLVGINTHRLGDGFYLAIPADAALRQRIAALAGGGVARRPRLGLGLAPASVARALRRSVGLPEREGLLVRGVEAGSPAARAGVQEGDLLVAAGGRPLATADDLFDALDAVAAGGDLELVVVRGVEERTITVAFAGPSGADADDEAAGEGTPA
jgi:serine protease Do